MPPTETAPFEALYRALVRCRSFEAALGRYAAEAGAGVPHPYSGQEGVAAGVCTALEVRDRVVSSHRMLGHAVARGCDLRLLASELHGRPEGLCRGRSGEMYVCQYDVGFMGATQIVGGNLPMACGLALASRLDGTGRVVVAFIGDGAVNQGAFGESLNLAGVWQLPLIVVVENNGYAESTPVEYAVSGDIVDRAKGYGLAAVRVDGQDAVAVYGDAAVAVTRAREGGGPTLIEADTYRYEGHYFGERHQRYRTVEEVAHWKERDPLAIHRSRMHTEGFEPATTEAIEEEAHAETDEAVRSALTGTRPTWADLVDDVFADSFVSRRYSDLYLIPRAADA